MSAEEDQALVRAVLRHLRNGPLDAEAGGRFLILAFRGKQVRRHFDQEHPDQIERGREMAPPEERGREMAPPEERDREAWLFGYRFGEEGAS